MNPGELKHIIYEQKEGIAYVTLNRPEVKNALNAQMVADLVSVWEHVRDDQQVETVILTGAGESFMNGRGDEAAVAASLGAERPPPTRPYRYSWNTPVSPKAHYVFKPVIVAINGECATSGLEQVSEADILICSDRATFFDNHVSYAAMVPLLCGPGKEALLQPRRSLCPGGRAGSAGCQEGIPDRLCDRGSPPPAADVQGTEIAKKIMRNSPTAVQASLEVLWHSLSMGLRDAMQLDSYMQRHYNSHPDLGEARRATVENRRPKWLQSYWHGGH